MEREGKVGMGLCACLQLKSVWFGACLLGSIWLGILFFFPPLLLECTYLASSWIRKGRDRSID